MRNFAVFIFLVYGLVVHATIGARVTTAAQQPNVIVVMTDDQGYGEFSCHGNPITQTPNIDRLASQSIRFTDFHVAPMCTPTRGQLLTGLDAFRSGAINVSSGRTLLRPELTTIADVFRQAGYRTGIFGKWHLGDNYPFRPQDRGFDHALWFPSSHINSVPDYWDNDYFDDTYLLNGKRKQYEGYCTDVFFQEAMRWIESDNTNKKPFLAYIPLNSAHWPWFVPDEYRDPLRKSIAGHAEISAKFNKQKTESLVSFLAMGASIDDNVGRLDQLLNDAGLFENTIVVFLTDNGSTMGQDYFNAGMKGKKTTLWEGGHRVPCFIRWPEGMSGGPKAFDDLTHVQDLMPTLADLAGIKTVPENLDGVSLAKLVRGEADKIDERMLVINYSRMPQMRVTYTDGNPAIPQRNGAGVLWKKWRLLEGKRLYDVQKDPHQDHDVAAEHAEVVTKLNMHLDAWWEGVKETVLEPQRVVIGNDAENPMTLTACEWLDVFVDQQVQIRRGDRKNGIWHLIVDQPGRYSFELRRWPRESELKLTAGLPATPVTDGTYIKGIALPIRTGKIRIGDLETTGEPDASGKFVRFEAALEKGTVELQTWLIEESGVERGAYYVYVNRNDD